MVPAFNLSAGEIHVYKTRHHPRFQTDYKVKAVQVALATSAAPTYFPVHRSEYGMLMIDGGFGQTIRPVWRWSKLSRFSVFPGLR